MSSKLRQIAVVTVSNLKSLPRRVWISLSMILSVALVVAVLIGFLAMARGFEKTLESAGSETVAVVLGGGARDERGSEIPTALLHRLQAAPEAAGIAVANGRPRISRELVVPVDAKRADTGDSQTIALRGMDAEGAAMRDIAQLTRGSLFTPGARQIVVGADIAARFDGFDVGDTVVFGRASWEVVGHFRADGSVFASEIWADLGAVQAEFDRQGQVQTLRVALATPGDTAPVEAALAQAEAPVIVATERAFFAGQSERTTRIIRLFGWPIAILMAIGATAGALNTMLSSVSDRAGEIATLRTIGFSRIAAFMGTWVEATALTIVGAVVGGAASLMLFTGWQTSTAGANSGQISFTLAVTPEILMQAGLLALAIGLIGGALPALSAARMPLTRAMRDRP